MDAALLAWLRHVVGETYGPRPVQLLDQPGCGHLADVDRDQLTFDVSDLGPLETTAEHGWTGRRGLTLYIRSRRA